MAASVFACLAHPACAPARRRHLLSSILIEDVQVRISGFLRQFSDEIRKSSSGLVEVLSSWEKGEASYQEAMGLPIGLLPFRAPSVDRTWAAAASALHLTAAGRRGEWEASFNRPISLRWGTFVTPALRRLVVSDGDTPRLRLFAANGFESSIDLFPTTSPEASAGWQALEEIDVINRSFVILDPEDPLLFPLPMLEVRHSTQPPDLVARTLRSAVSLIRDFAAEYAPWIEDVLWALFPVCPPNEQGYSSGSVKGLYGIIYESFPVSPLHAAEGLIHEACHQYYHLAQLETLFANGQDTRLYWSPYPKQDRPIDRILLAFHAFANLVFFYRACLAGGMPFETERAKVEISFHIDNLQPFSEALEHSPGLTADGRALFEAIHERLFG